ncbi:MAG TPA: Maf family protein [Dermatophilaceae bacterium]|nr:Maf family protein [Dermatophilaceae bacterium]
MNDRRRVPRLVLASASPARLRTLRGAGLAPTVVVSSVDEARAAAGCAGAAEVALVLARAKCEDVAGGGVIGDQPGALVLGCDSVLELDGQVLGKPASTAEATLRWRDMRGRDGVLHTGHWLRDLSSGRAVGEVASTRVWFADLSETEIGAYVQSGEPLQVAGAFTIDGLGGAFVTRIEGDPHNVVGVSLPLLRVLLARLGVVWTDLWAHAPG